MATAQVRVDPDDRRLFHLQFPARFLRARIIEPAFHGANAFQGNPRLFNRLGERVQRKGVLSLHEVAGIRVLVRQFRKAFKGVKGEKTHLVPYLSALFPDLLLIVAADLLGQAEHDSDAVPVLVTTSRPLALAVAEACDRQLETLPTATIAREALSNGAAVICESLDELIEVVNRFGSFFYGSILGVFLLAMIPRARGTGAFVGLIAGMTVVGFVNFGTDVAYLWQNVIGAVVVLVVGMVLGGTGSQEPAAEG